MIYRTTRAVQASNGEGCFIFAEWHGGEYIELGRVQSTRPDEPPAALAPSQVINVWDHVEDHPRIERTQGALEAKIDDWIENYGVDSLVHDVRENW